MGGFFFIECFVQSNTLFAFFFFFFFATVVLWFHLHHMIRHWSLAFFLWCAFSRQLYYDQYCLFPLFAFYFPLCFVEWLNFFVVHVI